MSERGRQQQTAIWELVETEVVYLKTVKVITDVSCIYFIQLHTYLYVLLKFLLYPSEFIINTSSYFLIYL